jgi:hypothetical protein
MKLLWRELSKKENSKCQFSDWVIFDQSRGKILTLNLTMIFGGSRRKTMEILLKYRKNRENLGLFVNPFVKLI